MTYLLLMRHAKAEPYNSSDKERRLVARGHAQSALSGEFIANWAQRTGGLDTALVSTATRAQETFTHTKVTAAHVVHSDALYLATPYTMLEEINEQLKVLNAPMQGDEATLLVVAHEPTISGLAYFLAHAPEREGSEMGDLDGYERASHPLSDVQYGVPTATVCVLRFDAAGLEPGEYLPVGDAAQGQCELLEVFSPH